MGDPVSTGLIMEAAAPEVAGAMGIGELAGAGAIANPFTTAMTTGMTAGGYGAGGESLFGFDPSIRGFGQGVMESLGSANKFINANPVTSQIGFSLAKQAFEPNKPRQMAPAGQIHRGQVQPMDYMSLLNPQNQQVMRPQPISLL
jgi:hypothetical protein